MSKEYVPYYMNTPPPNYRQNNSTKWNSSGSSKGVTGSSYGYNYNKKYTNTDSFNEVNNYKDTNENVSKRSPYSNYNHNRHPPTAPPLNPQKRIDTGLVQTTLLAPPPPLPPTQLPPPPPPPPPTTSPKKNVPSSTQIASSVSPKYRPDIPPPLPPIQTPSRISRDQKIVGYGNQDFYPHSPSSGYYNNRGLFQPPLPQQPPPKKPPPPKESPPSNEDVQPNLKRYNGKTHNTPITTSYYPKPVPTVTFSTATPPPSFYHPKPAHLTTPPSSAYPSPAPQQSVGYSGMRSYFKRKSDEQDNNARRNNKKRKKPLSQAIPQRKDWSVEDAKRAITVEKESNKCARSTSLFIKFPDLELNKEIVSRFHSSIESVHFQQPSTPRFCFVTLSECADPETVIRELNRVRFGQGYLQAEFKKDREDDLNIGPEDIDPLTLYVGNLAQEVTKEDMMRTYPKTKRIDIGYAKKMKYTRYAFVSFKTVDDAIEAFKKTHSTQMHSKSLIVRFRRLHGTVGMPGEPKPQMPQKVDSGVTKSDVQDNGILHQEAEETEAEVEAEETEGEVEAEETEGEVEAEETEGEVEAQAEAEGNSWGMVDVSNWETETLIVKQEPIELLHEDEAVEEEDDDDEEEEEEKESKPPIEKLSIPFLPGCIDLAFSLHKPKMMPTIKKEKPTSDDESDVNKDAINEEKIKTENTTNKPNGLFGNDNVPLKIEKDEGTNEINTHGSPSSVVKTESAGDVKITYNQLRLLSNISRNSNSEEVRVKEEKDTDQATAWDTRSDQVIQVEDTIISEDSRDSAASKVVVSSGNENSENNVDGVSLKTEPVEEDQSSSSDEDDSMEEVLDFGNLIGSLKKK